MALLSRLTLAGGVLAVICLGLFIMNKNNVTNIETNQNIISTHSVGEFNNLIPFTMGRISMLGSIADSDAERQLGLSNTKEIPVGVAKIFIFDTSDTWSFWMKDMNYSIDIFWLDENGRVVYVVESVSPETYPHTSFAPQVPAKYVIETKAGFAKENNITVGAVAGMTQILFGR
jgi:uncharacterized membrane protein (UPF0127 family)